MQAPNTPNNTAKQDDARRRDPDDMRDLVRDLDNAADKLDTLICRARSPASQGGLFDVRDTVMRAADFLDRKATED